MNLHKVIFILVLFFVEQNLHAQKYSFKIKGQYSHYENENSEKADYKVVFLCNNDNDTNLKFYVINDTIKNISIFDKKTNKVFFSDGGFVVDVKTNLSQKLATCKFDLRQSIIDEKTNKNVTISLDSIGDISIMNIREAKRKKILNDLYIKIAKNSKYTNTQNFTISMITHHRIWGIEKINNEIILESYYLKNNIKTDVYKLDSIEEVNFEIKMN